MSRLKKLKAKDSRKMKGELIMRPTKGHALMLHLTDTENEYVTSTIVRLFYVLNGDEKTTCYVQTMNSTYQLKGKFT